MRVPAAAADFVPRLDDLHRALDEAVCSAYGWPPPILNDDEAILRQLLGLNRARAGAASYGRTRRYAHFSPSRQRW